MSEGMPIADLFKSSPEVTSLATTDRILAFDSNGEPKKISRSNTVNQGTAQIATAASGESNWLRVASVNYNSCGIIKVFVTWGSVSPAMIIFSLLVHVNGQFKVQCLSRLATGSMFSKIRVVKKSNAGGYVDVYAPTSKAESFGVSLIGCNAVTLDLGTATDATIPVGYDAVEFDSSNWGGVNGYLSTVYNSAQKGGGQYERSTSANVGHRGSTPAVRDYDAERKRPQSQRSYHHRHIPGYWQSGRGTGRIPFGRIPLRQSCGIWWDNIHRAGVPSTSDKGRIPLLSSDAVPSNRRQLGRVDGIHGYGSAQRHNVVVGKEVAA